MADSISFDNHNNDRKKVKIKRNNQILSILKLPMTIEQLIVIHKESRKPSFYNPILNNMVKSGHLAVVGKAEGNRLIYQRLKDTYHEALKPIQPPVIAFKVIERYNQILQICKQQPRATFKMIQTALGYHSLSAIKKDCNFLIEKGYLLNEPKKIDQYQQTVHQHTTLKDTFEIESYMMVQHRTPPTHRAKQASQKLPGGKIYRLEDYQDRYAATQRLREPSKRCAWIGNTLSTMVF